MTGLVRQTIVVFCVTLLEKKTTSSEFFPSNQFSRGKCPQHSLAPPLPTRFSIDTHRMGTPIEGADEPEEPLLPVDGESRPGPPRGGGGLGRIQGD